MSKPSGVHSRVPALAVVLVGGVMPLGLSQTSVAAVSLADVSNAHAAGNQSGHPRAGKDLASVARLQNGRIISFGVDPGTGGAARRYASTAPICGRWCGTPTRRLHHPPGPPTDAA